MSRRAYSNARIAAITLTMALAVVLFVFGYRRFDLLIVEERHPTVVHAIDAGMQERGWLASFVPPSATDLRELHDLDTNESRGTFEYAEADEPSLLSVGRELATDAQLALPRAPFDGWPLASDRTACLAELAATGATIRRVDDGGRRFFLAVFAGRNLAAYWTPDAEPQPSSECRK